MKRIFTLFLLVCAMTCIPYQLMAAESDVTVTIHFLCPSDWTTVKAYAYYGDATTLLGNWPGTEATASTDDNWTTNKETLNGTTIASWKITVPEANLSDTKVIFYNGSGTQYPASGQTGFVVADGAYYDTNGLNKTFDTAYEMVATYGGKTVVLPMTASRKRNSTVYDYEKWTVGFKDEALPGEKDNDVKVYVRGKNKQDIQFRPTSDNSTLGSNYSNLAKVNNTSLTGYYNEAYTTENKENCFIIKKGSGVSYTVGLNTGSKQSWAEGSNNNISYEIAANSLSLYVNKSIDALYRDVYSSSYKNTATETKKANLEDYYMLGYVTDGAKYQASKATALKMSKRIYLNPKDNSVVDSIVYSGIVKKREAATNGEGSYRNLYFSFLPSSVFDDNSKQTTSSAYDSNNIWNYVVRPQVQDEYDGSALSGAVSVSGYKAKDGNTGGVCNGEQSLNPLVDDSYNYYVIHLNTTTSTYRIELVKDITVTIPISGIRTFCSTLNLQLPENYKAYAAHDFEASTDNTSYNGQSNGTVKLRSLKYIPENEPVVLIYCGTLTDAKEQNFTVLTATDDNVTDTPEEWWSQSYSGETYANYLVASLYGLTIENGTYNMTDDGKYDYKTRHFALNQFSKTKYYKEHYTNETNKPEDYWGFFRAAGTVKAGYAYLSLPADKLGFNGQITGNVKENTDDANAESKVALSFDVNPWNDSTTGISEVQASRRNAVADEAYYTLQGIKVTHPTQGIYIYKGKKIKR